MKVLSFWQEVAHRVFRFASISGDGDCYLLSKCPGRWKIKLFKTEAGRGRARDAWEAHGCGSRCRRNHDTGLLR